MTQDAEAQSADWNRYRSCFFCYHPREGEIVATRSLSVVFDDSPIVEGHIMIHSRQHWGCAAELPPDQFEELTVLKGIIGELVTKVHGSVAFYEHGRAGHCSSWQGGPECEHFHLHALPIEASIEPVLATRFRRVPMTRYGDLREIFETHGDYLYFEDAQGNPSVFPANTEVESHALRTMIANAIGDPVKSNWEGMRNPQMVDASRRKVERLREELEAHVKSAGLTAP